MKLDGKDFDPWLGPYCSICETYHSGGCVPRAACRNYSPAGISGGPDGNIIDAAECIVCGWPKERHEASKEKPQLVRPVIRFRTMTLLERAIEEGVRLGLSRSRKHNDNPSSEFVAEQVVRAIMESLDEIIDFNEERS